MLVIELTFPAGRYHATPWGRHVNEGVSEWPPSPYRLVRALFDAWKRKRPEWRTDRVEPILVALASELPRFRLPAATASHTRSFLSANTTDPTDKRPVFDAFVVVGRKDALVIGWPTVALLEEQRADLGELLSLLNYLGRSESWVSARLAEDAAATDWNCLPESTSSQAPDKEIVPVACPVSKDDYGSRPFELRAKGRKAKPVRVSWMEALSFGTAEMLALRLSGPPALIQAGYSRSRKCFLPPPVRRTSVIRRPPRAVLYALESSVLPQVTETLEVAERVRRKLMGCHKRAVGDETKVSPKFSGKDEAGEPQRGHRHAYFLPFDQDRDGRLDRLIVTCCEPFDSTEKLALDWMRSLWQPNGRPDIRCIPLKWGDLAELLPAARVLTSATPFVPPRHYRKGRGDFAEWLAAEVRREAENHGLAAPVRVSPVERLEDCAHPCRWIEFRRNRKGDQPALGFGFELEFEDPVRAPVALGYGAHFGLGLFRPTD